MQRLGVSQALCHQPGLNCGMKIFHLGYSVHNHIFVNVFITLRLHEYNQPCILSQTEDIKIYVKRQV